MGPNLRIAPARLIAEPRAKPYFELVFSLEPRKNCQKIEKKPIFFKVENFSKTYF